MSLTDSSDSELCGERGVMLLCRARLLAGESAGREAEATRLPRRGAIGGAGDCFGLNSTLVITDSLGLD